MECFTIYQLMYLIIDEFYGDVYSIFNQIDIVEYIDTCNIILKNYKDNLKYV